MIFFVVTGQFADKLNYRSLKSWTGELAAPMCEKENL